MSLPSHEENSVELLVIHHADVTDGPGSSLIISTLQIECFLQVWEEGSDLLLGDVVLCLAAQLCPRLHGP